MKYKGLVPNILNLPAICVISNTVLAIKGDGKFKEALDNKIDLSSITEHKKFLSTRTPIINETSELVLLTIDEIKTKLETNYVVVYRLDYESINDSKFEDYKFYCIVLDEDPKIEINSKYLFTIVYNLLTGNTKLDGSKYYVKSLYELAHNTKELIENPDLFKENWSFNDKKKPSQEEIENFKKIYDKFIEENNVNEPIYTSHKIDRLLDALSKLYDDNDPISFLKFADKFDRSEISGDVELNYKYNEAMEHPQTIRMISIYIVWKSVIEKQYDLSNPKINKYLIAFYYDSVENILKIYELLNRVVLDRNKCIKILPEVIKELHDVFNPFDFVEKYYISRLHENNKDFTRLFISQYIKQYKPELKLF
jgi:hypothetical protein